MKRAISKFLEKIYHFLLLLSQSFHRNFPGGIKKVQARVISVGNITWGGTGKTPLVAMLSKALADSGKKVAVLTRGYGQDEVKELAKKLPGIPIIVGRNRARSANEAIRKHQAEFLILDDGFQHIGLHRDLDVLNINTVQPFGPGGLIPSGTLREPVEHLSRADVFVLTKSNIGGKNVHWIKQKIQSIKKEAIIFEAVHRPIQFLDMKRNRFVPLQEIQNRRVASLAGIADPHSFEKSLEHLGAQIVLAGRFDDHHDYTDSELAHFAKKMRELNVRDVVTTQKDYYRIEPLLRKKRGSDIQNMNVLVLEIEFELNDEEEFLKKCIG